MLPQRVRQTRFLHFTVTSVMALNDSCHLLIETKHHFIQKSGGGGLSKIWGGLEPLSPIAGAATSCKQYCDL